MKICFIIICK